MAKPEYTHSKGKVKVTWLGHSAFHLESPQHTIMLIDPWLENPKAPPSAKDISTVDIILVTHGHSDHLGNTVELAKRTVAKVFAIHEVSLYLQRAGVPQAAGMNKSGTVVSNGVSVTMVDAKHSGGLEVDGKVEPGGEPAGYVIRFENGFAVYHAGDTAVFGDMKLIAELYKPDLVLLPIGGLYTMGPREAAKACRLLSPTYIMGMHYGTFPALAGTPEELMENLPPRLKSKVRIVAPGKSITFP